MIVLAAGAFIVLVGLIFSFRIMRRGIGSLESSSQRLQEKIDGEERRIAEDVRNMSSAEHMDVTTAAVRDLLRLTPGREACPVEVEGRRLVLHLPEGDVSLALAMQEASLRSLHKRIQGHAVWQVRGCRRDADFHDVGSAMRHLDHILRGHEKEAEELPQFARRFAPARGKALPAHRHMTAAAGRLAQGRPAARESLPGK
ncbi:DUF948 domain-containing protein [uncultured Desulfovibrio sp.]|uniref:DUF948 domain-containing protein n=1 Tax=uncultured Desulfovibrio sp. TaxID=167968 RepID=UPI0025DDEC68|nr:DUF948 domain-containing protein [uncultured Desulfovibrio sp.]